MYQKLFSLISCLFLCGFFACTPEEFEKPLSKERFFYRFVNLNSRIDPVDVRLNNIDGLNWLGFDINFEEKEPSRGYGSILVSVVPDSLEKDTSDYLFLEVLGHRSKAEVVPALGLDTVSNSASTLGRDPWSLTLIDDRGSPLLIYTQDGFDLEEAKGGKAGIRFVNVNYLFVSVSLEIKDDTTAIRQQNFLNSSGFFYPKAETRTIYYRNDLTRTIIDSISNVNLEPGKIYSFYLTQDEGEPVVGYNRLN